MWNEIFDWIWRRKIFGIRLEHLVLVLVTRHATRLEHVTTSEDYVWREKKNVNGWREGLERGLEWREKRKREREIRNQGKKKKKKKRGKSKGVIGQESEMGQEKATRRRRKERERERETWQHTQIFSALKNALNFLSFFKLQLEKNTLSKNTTYLEDDQSHTVQSHQWQ